MKRLSYFRESQSKSILYYCTILFLILSLTGCWEDWASRGIKIDTERAGAISVETIKLVDQFAFSHQLVRMGKGGYDEINGTVTTIDYQGPDEIMVSIGLGRKKYIPIRINQKRAVLSPRALQLFDELSDVLSQRWPGAVIADDVPEKEP